MTTLLWGVVCLIWGVCIPIYMQGYLGTLPALLDPHWQTQALWGVLSLVRLRVIPVEKRRLGQPGVKCSHKR